MAVPRSEIFDDVYFSAENGLAETQHVFLDGNNLPENWKHKDRFVIAETGFGTGLNFLSAWKLFDETCSKNQTLHFISIEKYPLEPDEIYEYLHPLLSSRAERSVSEVKSKDLIKSDEEEDPSTSLHSGRDNKISWLNYLEKLCAHYPLKLPGFHRVHVKENITLTLIFDDINEALPRLNAQIDCWFLDGFKPSTNPQMWSEILFKEMNRLSKPGATFATFTAAGAVKRGLQNAGFNVQKVPGFGRKREMLTGEFKP